MNNKTTKIKWFSAINQEDKNAFNTYIQYYTKAVKSSKINSPCLDPYLILDGEEDDNIKNLKDNYGVTVIHHRLTFYDKLKAYYKGDTTASGAYLRCDLPIILKNNNITDDYVLYTDNDVLFLNDVSGLLELTPKFFNISSEFSKDYLDVNSGVMWINTKSMIEVYDDFIDFIVKNFKHFKVYDQDAIKIYFDEDKEILDYSYNYKPYWGGVRNIRILHFHGPKPAHYEMCKKGEYPLMQLVNSFYYEMVERYNNL